MSVEILLVLAAALLLDRIVGDPDWLWRRLPHPVVLFGAAIGWFDRSFNRKRLGDDALRISGAISLAALLLLSAGIGLLFHRLFASMGLVGLLFETVIVAVFLAQKSLGDHVMRVASGLRKDGLAGGRKAVSMIVGRDPETLDEPAVCRAAIESLAENFSDGVVAPAFWYAIFGLPGLLAYKMLNTADSMIGHKSPKYLYFGWASARLDDLANLPAARLSVLLFAAGAWLRVDRRDARNALDVGLRDHGLHRSPNSGWPEAAMAGALDVQLAGPRLYAGTLVSEPMINGAGRATATVPDIEKAVHIFYAACAALMITVVFLVAVPSFF
ncbi:adenosylcobinamide-phosphate synthase CbiB [Rhizobium sp. 32-5/1]|uniref:adenosylcobinamide-phosphate synthase CbiB n=1 Tax=Rhizobium sp. 32-5/1 TaxID=3019602 RepID=UPI00240D4233|nr:adenosylcobinamide-phosphate synthase CbiB [Rhizobium sp. 32-5/1]WEZ83216.1 adenosylcobinamide-phosphate synthase CbiB [Rhizobium sp. 32-5/1]